MSNQIAIKIEHPLLTKSGTGEVSTRGFRVDAAIEHLQNHLKLEGPKKWCGIAHMARTMFQRNTPENVKKMRARVSKIFHELLEQNAFLVIRYDLSTTGRGRIESMKIYQSQIEADREYAALQLDRMRRRSELTDSSVKHAQQLLGLDQ